MSRWPVAGPSGYWLLASSPASKVRTVMCIILSNRTNLLRQTFCTWFWPISFIKGSVRYLFWPRGAVKKCWNTKWAVNREILGTADLHGLKPQKAVIFVVTSEFQCVVAFENLLHLVTEELQLLWASSVWNRHPIYERINLMWFWPCIVVNMLQHPANRTHNPQLHTRPATWKPQHEIPQAATTV